MIGYHATAHRNVDSILKNGLRPYPINKPWAGTVQGSPGHAPWKYHEGVMANIVWSRTIAPSRITVLGTTDFSQPAGIEDFDPVSLPYPEPVRAQSAVRVP